jgi:ribosomal protein S18 acetylase RimI-like enzyme
VHVAPLKHAQAGLVSALFAQVVQGLPYYNQVAQTAELTKYSTAKLRKLVTDDPGSVLVANVAGKSVGFCFSSQDDSLIWMAWIGVHPAYRRIKVASSLIQSLELRAEQLGSHKIWCDCRTTNVASRKMLTNNGFRQICTISNHWFGQNFILWEKMVSSEA